MKVDPKVKVVCECGHSRGHHGNKCHGISTEGKPYGHRWKSCRCQHFVQQKEEPQ